MPFKRTYRRKRTFKKRTSTKKRMYYRKRNTAIARKVNRSYDMYFFKRGSSADTFAELQGNIVHNPYLNTFVFSLNQVRNFTEFTNLFDQYRINHVQIKFFLRSSVESQSATSAVYPRMWWVTDYDDNNLNDIQQLRERNKVRTAVLLPNRPITVNVKPAVLTNLFNGALSSDAYSPQWGKWIDSVYPELPHYGLKYAIDQFTNTNYRLAYEVKFWLSFKHTR